jgi:quinol monooxygenase YgiN
MVKLGFFLQLETKPGSGAELEARLKRALPKIEQETGTVAWLAVRLGPTSYAVIDAFPSEEARQVHLEVGRKGLESIADLLAKTPTIVPTDIIAAKLP